MKKFTEILLMIGLLTSLFILIGCHSELQQPVKPVPVEVQTIVKNLSWIQMILIIGIVGSIFACFNGAAKIGIPLLISSLIGYGFTSAMLFYAKIIALISLIGGVGLCGYMIFLKHRALKEIVTGIQEFKENRIEANKDVLKDVLANSQSPSTEKIVKQIKEKSNG